MKQTPTKRFLKIAGMIIALALVIIAVILSILQGYAANWTGFGDFTTPGGEFVRGKTFWDWMEVFFIPGIVAVLIAFMNSRERRDEQKRAEERAKLERELTTDRQREAALQSYLDRMADMLLSNSFILGEEDPRNVARIRTLTVLRGLDAKRKGMILLFLRESELINKQPVISLTGADLNGAILCGADLNKINLSDADLRKADLSDANLGEAYLDRTILSDATLWDAYLGKTTLRNAYLDGAFLAGANLSEASLVGAHLNRANMMESDLTGADLSNTDLSEANLTGAKVLSEQLAMAGSLRGATMPDGTKHA